MMKVLQIAPSATTNGGVQTQVLTLTRGLLAQGIAVQVVIFEDGPLSEKYRELGISVDVIGGKSGHDLAAMLRMRKILRSSDADVIHFHLHPVLMGFAFAGVRSPLIRTFHWGSVRFSWKDRMIELLESCSSGMRKISGWGAVSGYVRDWVLRDSPRFEAISHQLIYNCIDIARFRPGTTESVATLEKDFREQRFRIGMVCRVAPDKHPLDAIQLIRILRDEYRISAQLTMIGDGPQLAECRQLAQSLGLDSQIRFTGNRVDPETFLRECHVSLAFSDSETFGLSILEGIACGAPVISYRSRGALQEWLHEGEGCLYTDTFSPEAAADRLTSLFRSTESWQALRQRGLDLVQRFSSQKCASQYIELYEEVLRQRTVLQ